MKRLLLISLAVAALGAWLWIGWEETPEAGRRLTLVTTTSTENSGLLSYLLTPWKKETGIEVRVIAVGTGQALALARRGDADLVLVHARAREEAFLKSGHGLDRRDIMWNDFVIAGPPSDPAALRGLHDAAEAFARIAARKVRFVSRGDDSGTHIRERALWARAGLRPPSGPAYIRAGQGMGPCLTLADQKEAYVLTDRGTFLATEAGKNLEILVEGDPFLRNPYGAMLVNPARHPHVHLQAARRLLDYLTSSAGQARIGAFRVDGQVLFHPQGAKR